MRKALQDHKQGSCEVCTARLPGWALYVPEVSEPAKNAICGACIAAQLEASVGVAVEAYEPWDGEAGKFAKAQRNIALDGSLWAVMPGSPLSVACQAKFVEYRTKLNRMTVDAASPETWVWPEVPALEYPVATTAQLPQAGAAAIASVKLSAAK